MFSSISLRRWFGSRPGTIRKAAPKRPAVSARLKVESLEQRDVPAVTLTNGVINITQTPGNDQATVSATAIGFQVNDNGRIRNFTRAQVWGGAVNYFGQAGDDRFTNNTSLVATASGGMGNDTLIGGSANDHLYGNEGDDRLEGREGSDNVRGHQGSDTLVGGTGNDFMYGSDGDDHVYGNEGDDTLEGGAGVDNLSGHQGNDTLLGGFGDDFMYGSDGDDHLYGNEGNDRLEGGAGIDNLRGHQGNDILFGGLGNDFLYGEAGQDELYGNEGIDRLHGGADDDLLDGGQVDTRDFLWGGSGRDTFRSDFLRLPDGTLVNIDLPLDVDPRLIKLIKGHIYDYFAEGAASSQPARVG